MAIFFRDVTRSDGTIDLEVLSEFVQQEFDPNLPGSGRDIIELSRHSVLQAQQAPQTPERQSQDARFHRIEQLLVLLFSSQANPPVTSMLSPITGDQLGVAQGGVGKNDGNYYPIYTNNFSGMVRVQIFLDMNGNPGEGIKLALGQPNDAFKVDSIGNVANLNAAAVPIMLKPQQSLFAAVYDKAQPLTVGTVIRGRVFDPNAYSDVE